MAAQSLHDAVKVGRGPAPSTKLRRAVFEACRQRSDHASNLWLVYSARHDRRWVVTSDVEYLHFLTLEFAPDILEFDLAPAPDIVRLRDEDRKTTFDAIVRFCDGRTECRELKRLAEAPSEPEEELRIAMQEEAQLEAAKRHGGVYRRLCLRDLEPFQIRIQNSLRMLRFLTATRGEPLNKMCHTLQAVARSNREGTTLRMLIASVPEADAAIAYAATFKLVLARKLTLPIDSEIVTGGTLVGGPT